MKKKILIIDDHPVLREGLSGFINRSDELEVCGLTDNAAEAFELIKIHQPDLAVVDISLGTGSGLELAKDIHARHESPLILILSMHDETLYAERALKAGARGYIMKNSAAKNILNAIETVLAGQIYLSPTMTNRLLAKFTEFGDDSILSDFEKLTDRELQVFELIGAGRTTRDIADILKLSVRTIESYRENMKSKLNVDNAAGLISRAVLWVHANNVN